MIGEFSNYNYCNLCYFCSNRIEFTTPNGQPRSRSLESRLTIQSNLQAEVPKLKKCGLKRLKLRWKTSEQEECAVCLEQFNVRQGENLIMQLPCAHRFHTNCLAPWLEGNRQCP
ncbi:hypothetical protein Pfo_003486 [Paulownia fortunei]|nr:hypothetical protein Pfo_003486 [Paulownia fortunei]